MPSRVKPSVCTRFSVYKIIPRKINQVKTGVDDVDDVTLHKQTKNSSSPSTTSLSPPPFLHQNRRHKPPSTTPTATTTAAIPMLSLPRRYHRLRSIQTRRPSFVVTAPHVPVLRVFPHTPLRPARAAVAAAARGRRQVGGPGRPWRSRGRPQESETIRAARDELLRSRAVGAALDWIEVGA